jgi:endonuclease/exonuclease/phosphatase family metal-dependent hydrolase
MRIKIICLNLWLGGKLLEPALEFIKKEKPDILAVQEAYDAKDERLEERFRSIEVIKKKCGFEYVFFSPSCMAVFPDKKIPAGNAILSRFPFLDSKTTFIYSSFREEENYELPTVTDFSYIPRNLQHVLIEVSDTKLNIFNTQGIWRKDSKDSEERLKMSEIIVQEIKEKDDVILCGDFNVTPDTQTIRNVEKHLKNVFKGELKNTFNMKRKNDPAYSNFVVDMMFASNNLKVVDHYCPDVDVSDHLPLVALIEN